MLPFVVLLVIYIFVPLVHVGISFSFLVQIGPYVALILPLGYLYTHPSGWNEYCWKKCGGDRQLAGSLVIMRKCLRTTLELVC